MNNPFPIWYPLAAIAWLCIAGFTIFHNWGWWRPAPYDSFLESTIFNTFFGVFGLFVAALILGAISSGLSYYIGSECDYVWHPYWKGKLATLRNSDGVEGSVSGGMFVLVGHIESAEIYYYYTEESDGVYKPHKWRPDGDTTIFEENRKDAEVFQFDAHFKKSWVGWFAENTNDRIKMDFHIPKGSIVQQYQLK